MIIESANLSTKCFFLMQNRNFKKAFYQTSSCTFQKLRMNELILDASNFMIQASKILETFPFSIIFLTRKWYF